MTRRPSRGRLFSRAKTDKAAPEPSTGRFKRFDFILDGLLVLLIVVALFLGYEMITGKEISLPSPDSSFGKWFAEVFRLFISLLK